MYQHRSQLTTVKILSGQRILTKNKNKNKLSWSHYMQLPLMLVFMPLPPEPWACPWEWEWPWPPWLCPWPPCPWSPWAWPWCEWPCSWLEQALFDAPWEWAWLKAQMPKRFTIRPPTDTGCWESRKAQMKVRSIYKGVPVYKMVKINLIISDFSEPLSITCNRTELLNNFYNWFCDDITTWEINAKLNFTTKINSTDCTMRIYCTFINEINIKYIDY